MNYSEMLNFELATIQENAFIYETHLKNVNRRRDMWTVAVKDKIKSTLESIQSNFKRIEWEDLQISKQLRKHLVTIEPSYVTDGVIAGFVQQFLADVTSYESGV